MLPCNNCTKKESDCMKECSTYEKWIRKVELLDAAASREMRRLENQRAYNRQIARLKARRKK